MASLEDQYQKALRLYQEDSANDPESEPYKSKYAAREIFEELKSRLSKQLDEDDVDDAAEDQLVEEGVDGVGLTRARMAAVVYHLGVIAVETEELSTGEEHLKRALIILGDHEGIATGVSSMKVGDEGVLSAALSGDVDSLLSSSSSETVSVSPATISATSVALAISCHNQLGILWSHRNVFSTARRHLDRANVIYEEYQKQNANSPRTIHSLFSACTEGEPDENSGTAALEKLHTLTFYYLAQVFGHLGMPEKSAWYCHSTLQRQLASKDYDPVEWAINAATLSQFYQGKEKFRTARHLLASASKVLSSHEAEFDTQQAESEETASKQERYKRRCADVARCWGRYCLLLMQVSVNRAIPDDPQDEPSQQQEPEEESLDRQLEFVQLEVSDLESEVVSAPVSTFEEMRPLFLCGLRHFTEARQYYSLEDHASDHVSITQDMSQLYKALAFFEPSEDRRSKMHKRRIDLLKILVQELNPQYYLHVCRQLNYEIAETYSAMMDSKLALLEHGSGTPTPAQAKKINTLATSSIQHFLHYLDSMKDTASGEQPEKYSEDSVRPALIAWFHLGRLWSKLVSPSPQSRLQNIAHSLQNYKRVVAYCEKNPDCESVVAQELAICREMVQLLPLKMEQIRAQC